jgi:hypothetical protein
MMDRKALITTIAVALVIGFMAGVFGGGIASVAAYRLLAVRRTPWRATTTVAWPMQTAVPSIPAPFGWHSTDPAAPDSIEGKLRAEGKRWVRTSGEITVGSYVLDTYEGRMNQPPGRGAIGKVVFVSAAIDPGPPGAMVDFGRGYEAGFHLTELSLVQIIPK